MTNLATFTRRLRAVTAALAPTVGQECAEEAARSIAGILADGSENVHDAIAQCMRHRFRHAGTYGERWGELLHATRMDMTYAAVAAWMTTDSGAEVGFVTVLGIPCPHEGDQYGQRTWRSTGPVRVLVTHDADRWSLSVHANDRLLVHGMGATFTAAHVAIEAEWAALCEAVAAVNVAAGRVA